MHKSIVTSSSLEMTSTLVQDILAKRELSFVSNSSEDTGYSANSCHSSFSEDKHSPNRVVYSVNGYSTTSTQPATVDDTLAGRRRCHLNENKRSNTSDDIKQTSATGSTGTSSVHVNSTPASRRRSYINESKRNSNPRDDKNSPTNGNGYPTPTTKRRSYTADSLPAKESQNNDAVIFSPPTSVKMKRSPSSTSYLSDLKEKLLKEVTKIDIELKTIEREKCVLLDIRVLVHNFQHALWESERNSQGLLIPEKLKLVIEKIIVDINSREEVLIGEDGIPYFLELCKHVTNVKDSSCCLVDGSKRLNIEDIEELFSQSGQLYGVIDAMLVIFYEQPLAPECNEYGSNGSQGNQDQSTKQVTNEQSGTQVHANHHTDSAICGNCMEHMHLNDSLDDGNVTNGYHGTNGHGTNGHGTNGHGTNGHGPNGHGTNGHGTNGRAHSDSSERPNGHSDDSLDGQEGDGSFKYEVKDVIQSMVKDIGKMKKCLKSVERMTSGRPKMKFLITKFQEIVEILKMDYLEKLDKYSHVLKTNFNILHEVLKTEKPGQCDLDNVRFLLSQLSGRSKILLKLERDDLQH